MSSKKWFGFKRPYSKRSFHRYEPFYDDHADYNTNAKSYYDYLARFNKHIRVMTDFINRLLNRNITFNNTDSVDFTKKGDWIDNGECEADNYNDVIEVSAVVNISDSTETRSMLNTDLKTFTIPNGSMIKNNGLWSPDYIQMIDEIDKELGVIQGDINDLDERVTINEGDITNIEGDISNIHNENILLRNALQKIVDNLFSSGAITTNNLNTFNFKSNRNIASGNINLFGGVSDGNSFIRTSSGETENDITAGY